MLDAEGKIVKAMLVILSGRSLAVVMLSTVFNRQLFLPRFKTTKSSASAKLTVDVCNKDCLSIWSI